MPELPEVQTVVYELSDALTGKTIDHIEILADRLIREQDLDIHSVSKSKILNVVRRGKYILMKMENGTLFVSHLRMTGKYVDTLTENDENYIRAVIHFSDRNPYYFVDVRQFGTFYFTKNLNYLEDKLGPEPLSADFTSDYLWNVSRKSERPIKNMIMDQQIVVGVGNIYADESLFLSKIRPNKRISRISKPQIHIIVENIKLVLSRAIENMGTTLSDYRTTQNMSGENQHYLFVYGREGQFCKTCETEIKRIKLAGRSAHYCPACQK